MEKTGRDNPFGVTDARAEPASESQVNNLERRLGAKLPKDYRRFLMTINGGRRPGGGWHLPEFDLAIDTFYGLRESDFYDLGDAVDRFFKNGWTGHLLAEVIPIGYELGNNPILLKCGGSDVGSVFVWDEAGTKDWQKVAPSFDDFVAKLHQEPERRDAAEVRRIIEHDDVEAIRRHVNPLPPSKLDEADDSTGHSLLQRAADVGSVKIVAFLLDQGARSLAGMGIVNRKRHLKVAELLLTRANYKPTRYDWQGAVAFGGPALLRLYFKHAAPPSRTLLKTLVQNSKNLMKSKSTSEREETTQMLEDRLVP